SIDTYTLILLYTPRCSIYRHCPDLHSFPTRRSSDLVRQTFPAQLLTAAAAPAGLVLLPVPAPALPVPRARRQGSSTIPLNPQARSEEHTSELQSRENLVCRLLLEKKNVWRNDSQV